MNRDRNRHIAQSFGARADAYESQAGLQRTVAERLARFLPDLEAPRVLELGCGTGLFSRHLLARYPGGDFTFSDLSPDMLAEARRNLASFAGRSVAFAELDAAAPLAFGGFDLIATSMSLHWLERPADLLRHWREHLNPGGALLYAGLGPACFAEWRESLATEDLQSGLVPLPVLPGSLEESRIVIDGGGLAFLRRLDAIGGLTPRDGYRPLPPGALRRAIRRLDRDHAGRVTWHIVYGRLSGIESSAAASRSSASMIPL